MDFLLNYPKTLSFFMGFPGIILSGFFFIFVWILLKCLFLNTKKHGYWGLVKSEWMEFSESLGTVVLSSVLGILYIFIVPFFVFLFMRKGDILGKNLESKSFWHEARQVDFSLGRNYKLF